MIGIPGRGGSLGDIGARLEAVEVRAGTRVLVTGIELRVGPGDLVVLVGPNGAGKSTILRALVGRTQPTAGRALLDGREVQSYRGADRAARIAWLPQLSEIREPARVLDLVVAARYRFRESRRTAEEAARHALSQLGALHLAERRWPGLSGGERQRIALAALWAQEAPLFLLDEPANHLDPTQRIETYRWIAMVAATGRGVLCVTHDVEAIGWLAEAGHPIRVVGLREGTLRFALAWEDDALPAALGELFDVDFTSVLVDGRRRLVLVPEPSESPRR